jgi:hypothetical protein
MSEDHLQEERELQVISILSVCFYYMRVKVMEEKYSQNLSSWVPLQLFWWTFTKLDVQDEHRHTYPGPNSPYINTSAILPAISREESIEQVFDLLFLINLIRHVEITRKSTGSIISSWNPINISSSDPAKM